MSLDTSLDKCRAPSTLEPRHPFSVYALTKQIDSTANRIRKGRWKLSHKLFCSSLRRREFGTDDAPTARRMPARGNAPGRCPRTCSALKGRRTCALSGRTDQFRNPGRCPGLASGGAFSAATKDCANPNSQVLMHLCSFTRPLLVAFNCPPPESDFRTSKNAPRFCAYCQPPPRAL
jgi:hypothetical protein